MFIFHGNIIKQLETSNRSPLVMITTSSNTLYVPYDFFSIVSRLFVKNTLFLGNRSDNLEMAFNFLVSRNEWVSRLVNLSFMEFTFP